MMTLLLLSRHLLDELNTKGSLFKVDVSGIVVTFRTMSRIEILRISSISELLNNLKRN